MQGHISCVEGSKFRVINRGLESEPSDASEGLERITYERFLLLRGLTLCILPTVLCVVSERSSFHFLYSTLRVQSSHLLIPIYTRRPRLKVGFIE